MTITIQKSNQLKSIAILMMLFLHLFNRNYTGLFQPLLFIGSQPLSYYISLFCDACVPIFAFISGYGLYFKYLQDRLNYKKSNRVRLKTLYINYWVIVMLFAVLFGLILGINGYPGSFQKLFLNMTALETSYNGAWWFLTTYILFVLTSAFWFNLMEKLNPYLFFLILLTMYFTAFYFRVYRPEVFQNTFLDWFQRQTALYFCTLFQFMTGAFALKFKWHHKVSILFKDLRFRNAAALGAIAVLVVIHGLIPNFVVAPFTGIIFIFLFLQLQLPGFVNSLLDFFTPHATNIWLVHMFFYMIYFPDFIYSADFVLPIFGLLILCSVLSSYVIKTIEKLVTKMFFPSRLQPQR